MGSLSGVPPRRAGTRRFEAQTDRDHRAHGMGAPARSSGCSAEVGAGHFAARRLRPTARADKKSSPRGRGDAGARRSVTAISGRGRRDRWRRRVRNRSRLRTQTIARALRKIRHVGQRVHPGPSEGGKAQAAIRLDDRAVFTIRFTRIEPYWYIFVQWIRAFKDCDATPMKIHENSWEGASGCVVSPLWGNIVHTVFVG